MLLLAIGGFCSLLPDIPAVWNNLLYGTMEHTRAGPVPTHSLFFCSLAFIGVAFIGQLLYSNRDKAIALGTFAEAAALSHLLLDDVADGAITYFYPFYNKSMNLFSYVNVDLAKVNFMYYNLAGIVIVVFISCVMFMTLVSLNYLGFGIRYQPLGERNARLEYKTTVTSGNTLREMHTSQTEHITRLIDADHAEYKRR
ncbi:metal-dependent hydrolase [uncultured Methanomethylovorans sp.]|uniref:metal-dependent hydrolase n=1 Tax=uncultured Methanomethylovorans sp. TaxID=183759 RepID=UPI003749A7AB